MRTESKGYGVGGLIVGAKELPNGSPVVICDDVVTSGRGMIKASRAASSERGFQTTACLAAVDRQEDEGRQNIERELGVPFVALFTGREFKQDELQPHPWA